MTSNTFCNDPLSGINCYTCDLGRRLFGNNTATANEMVQIECRLLKLGIFSILSNNEDRLIKNELLFMELDLEFSRVSFHLPSIDTNLKSNILKYPFMHKFKKSIIQMILILQIKKRLLQIATL